jgi:hypothetical protein
VIQLLLCFALLIGNVSAAADKKSDKEQDGFKGPVGSVRVEKAEIKNENDKTVEGQRVRSQKILYNEKGEKVEMILYNGEYISRRLLFNKDTQGNTLATAFERGNPSASTPTADSSAPQENNGRKAFKHVFKYDERGNRTEDAVYSEDGTLLSKDIYLFDIEGNHFGVKNIDEKGVERSTRFMYDSKGVNVTRHFYSQTGKRIERRSYTYEFDAQGNWIKQTASKILDDDKSEPIEVIYRTISYYPPVGKYLGDVVGGVRNAAPGAKALYTEKGVIAIEGELIAGKPIRTVQPKYPPLAMAAKVAGAVIVEVTTDEEGDILSARALQGHSLLMAVSEKAALEWKFTPTTLKGEPVRVVGTLTFNFNR